MEYRKNADQQLKKKMHNILNECMQFIVQILINTTNITYKNMAYKMPIVVK